jgi:hypothetical protein
MDSGRDHENFESARVFADCYVAFGEAGAFAKHAQSVVDAGENIF